MEKLSSGYRINRAADDAAGLGISEKMRGQIGGLAQAQRNAQDGISLVQTAEGALAEVHSMLQRVRDLKVQFNNGTLDDRTTRTRSAPRSRRSPRRSAHHRPTPSSTASAVFGSTDTFSFQVGANEGETIAIAAADLRRRRRHRRSVRADGLAGATRGERRPAVAALLRSTRSTR